MPLTEEGKRRFIQQQGYNPEEVDFDGETGAFSYKVKESPNVGELTDTPPATGSSVLGSFTRGAIQNAGPAAVGLAAGGASLLVPGVASNPVSGLGVPLVVGGAASLGASALQNKLVPQSAQQKLFLRPEDEEQHPVASFLGGLAPMAATFNIGSGIKSLPKLLSGGRKVISGLARDSGAILPGRGMTQQAFEALPSYTPKALSPVEWNALRNAAIGVGSNVGLNTGEQLLSDQPYNPLGTLEAAGLGLLFNQPTKLGKLLSFDRSSTEITGQKHPVLGKEPMANRSGEIRSREDLLTGQQYPTAEQRLEMFRSIPRSEIKAPSVYTKGQTIEEVAGGNLAVKSEVKAAEPTPEPPKLKPLPLTKEQVAEVERVQLEQEIQANEKQEFEKRVEQRKEEARLQQEEAERTRELELQNQEIANLRAQRSTTDTTEANPNLPKPKGKVPPGGPEGMLNRYSDESTLTEEQRTRGLEASYQNTLAKAKELARVRGIELREEPVKGAQKSDGTEAAGVIAGRQATTGKVGVRAGDTTPHEVVGHGLVADYLHSSRKADNDLALAAIRRMPGGESEVYRYQQRTKYAKTTEEKIALKEALLSSGPAEELAKLVGNRGYERLRADGGDFGQDSLGKFFRDLAGKVGVKSGLGGGKSHADVLLGRSEFDAPFGAREELLGKRGESKPKFEDVEARYSSSSNLTPEQIRQGMEEDLGEASFKAAKQTQKALHEDKLTEDAVTSRIRNELFHKLSENEPKPGVKPLSSVDKDLVVDDLMQDTVRAKNFVRRVYGDELADEMEGFLHASMKREGKLGEILEESDDKLREATAKSSAKAEEYEAFTRPDVERHSDESTLTPEQIKEASEEPVLGPRTLRFMESALDAQRRKGGDFTKGADALDEVLNVSRSELARYEVEVTKALKGLSKDETKSLGDVLQSENDTGILTPDKLTGKAKDAYGVIRETLDRMIEDQRAAKHPTKDANDKRSLPISRPTDFPTVLDRNVIDTISTKKGSPEYQKLKENYIQYAQDVGEYDLDKAKLAFRNIEAQYSGSGQKDNFTSVREQDNLGVPESWREKDLRLALQRYMSKFTRDRAWWDTVESKPELDRLFGGKSDPRTNEPYTSEAPEFALTTDPEFQRVTNFARGWQDFGRQGVIDALSHPISAGLLGPLTGIGDAVSASTGMFKYAKITDIPKLLTAWGKIRDGYTHSLQSGNIRDSAVKLYEVTESASTFEDRMRQLASLMYKISGREALEKFSRSITQAYGEVIAEIKLTEASAGDPKAQELLKRLSNQRDYTKLTREELGTRLSQLHQGTYDVRQLPLGVVDSNIAPFLRLARWNIGQTNEFFKSVVRPAQKGDFVPLLNTLFGSVAGGLLVRELREQLGDKKDLVPSFKEIEASSNPDPYHKAGLKFYNLSAAAAYAGFGGLVGDLVKSLLDVGYGNKPRGFSYPAVDVASDLATRIPQAAKAIAQGEDVGKVAVKFSEDTAKGHFQMLRLALNQARRVAPDSKLAKEQTSQENRATLRRFKVVEGEKLPGITEANPYEGLATREFKRTDSVKEAQRLLPDLIQDAVKKAGGDPYKLSSELSKLRRNSYQTMPSPTGNSVEFAKYLLFLRKTKSPEEVAAITRDYWKHGTVNRIKSEMVPKLSP